MGQEARVTITHRLADLPYDYALQPMPRVPRLASSLLLAAGLVLVFAGLSTALGYTLVGMLASVGVVAALLYAGGIWFGRGSPTPSPPVTVFDRNLVLLPGTPLLDGFEETARATVRAQCLAALAGERAQFTAGGRTFDVTPIHTSDGAVLYGALIERRAVTAAGAVRGVQADVAIR